MQFKPFFFNLKFPNLQFWVRENTILESVTSQWNSVLHNEINMPIIGKCVNVRFCLVFRTTEFWNRYHCICLSNSHTILHTITKKLMDILKNIFIYLYFYDKPSIQGLSCYGDIAYRYTIIYLIHIVKPDDIFLRFPSLLELNNFSLSKL